jgi:hypothetical protein
MADLGVTKTNTCVDAVQSRSTEGTSPSPSASALGDDRLSSQTRNDGAQPARHAARRPEMHNLIERINRVVLQH